MEIYIGLRVFERYKGLSVVKLPFPQELNEFLAQLIPLDTIGLAIHFATPPCLVIALRIINNPLPRFARRLFVNNLLIVPFMGYILW